MSQLIMKSKVHEQQDGCHMNFLLSQECLFSYHAVNGFVMVVWIGQQVSGDLVTKLFGVTSQAQIHMDMVSQGLSILFLHWTIHFHFMFKGSIISQLQAGSQRCMKV